MKKWILFIDNSNFEIRDLWKYGIHLLESGKTKLGENFIYFFIFLFSLFLEAHIQQKY